MEQKSQHGTEIPGYTARFAAKLDLILKRYNSVNDAADVAGISRNQFSKYKRGAAAPSVFSIARLCQGVGISMDWLMSEASDPVLPEDDIENRPLDDETLMGAIEGLEKYLNDRSLFMAPDSKARTIRALYKLMILEDFRQKGENTDQYIDEFLRAANNK